MILQEMNQRRLLDAIEPLSHGVLLDIDIDNFEEINHKYGYSTGDQVLRTVPARIQSVVASHGLSGELIPIKHDEFVLILKEQTINDVTSLCENLLSTISLPLELDHQSTLKVTVSIGVAAFNRDSRKEEQVKRANLAMAFAKEQGKNQYQIAN